MTPFRPTYLHGRLSLYDKKLAPQGTLVFHISNRYYDLLGVIKSTSAEYWEGLAKMSKKDLEAFQSDAIYCLLHRKSDDVSALRAAGWLSLEGYPKECAPWSDDYINTLVPLYIGLRFQILPE